MGTPGLSCEALPIPPIDLEFDEWASWYRYEHMAAKMTYPI
jgi:hypothetical protein